MEFEKGALAQPTVVVESNVVAPPMAMATAVATPVMATATPVAAVPVTAVPQQGLPVQGGAPQAGRWSSDLCDCFDNCCICMSVWWCWACTAGQLYQRVMRPPVLSQPAFGGNGCVVVAISLIGLCVLWIVLGNGVVITTCGPACLVVSRIVFIAFIFIYICVVMNIRAAIRRRDQIQPQGDSCENCCVVWWCSACVQCQMLRHEVGRNYEFCSPTAGPLTPPPSQDVQGMPYSTAVA